MFYTWVPLGHLFNSDKQDIIEFIHTGLQDRLQPEHLPRPWNHFAADHIPIALKRRKSHIIQWIDLGPTSLTMNERSKTQIGINCYLFDLHLPAVSVLQHTESLPHCFSAVLNVEQLIFVCRSGMSFLRLCKQPLLVKTQKQFVNLIWIAFSHQPMLPRDVGCVPTASGGRSPGLSLRQPCAEVLHD